MSHPKFYDLPVWQASRRLARAIYTISNTGTFRTDWRLREQIRDAAASVMANIAEGFARRYDRELTQFLFVAKGSAAEVQSHLFVALDRSHLDDETFQATFDLADEVTRQISGLISYLTGRKRPRTAS